MAVLAERVLNEPVEPLMGVPLIAPPVIVAPELESVLSVAVLLAVSVVNAPELAVADPIGPGAANVAPLSVAALIAELHAKPDALVHCSALVEVLQLGMATAVGDALDAVALARTVFAACVASAGNPIRPVAVRLPVTVKLAMLGDDA